MAQPQSFFDCAQCRECRKPLFMHWADDTVEHICHACLVIVPRLEPFGITCSRDTLRRLSYYRTYLTQQELTIERINRVFADCMLKTLPYLNRISNKRFAFTDGCQVIYQYMDALHCRDIFDLDGNADTIQHPDLTMTLKIWTYLDRVITLNRSGVLLIFVYRHQKWSLTYRHDLRLNTKIMSKHLHVSFDDNIIQLLVSNCKKRVRIDLDTLQSTEQDLFCGNHIISDYDWLWDKEQQCLYYKTAKMILQQNVISMFGLRENLVILGTTHGYFVCDQKFNFKYFSYPANTSEWKLYYLEPYVIAFNNESACIWYKPWNAESWEIIELDGNPTRLVHQQHGIWNDHMWYVLDQDGCIHVIKNQEIISKRHVPLIGPSTMSVVDDVVAVRVQTKDSYHTFVLI